MKYVFISLLAWLIGYQIYNKDFLLLTRRYNYHIGIAQGITYIAFLITAIDVIMFEPVSIFLQLLLCLIGLIFIATSEFCLSRIQSSSVCFNIAVRAITVVLAAIVLSLISLKTYLPFFLMGWYVRNIKFGVPFRNFLVLAKLFKHHIKLYSQSEKVKVEIPKGIPDFSHAGNIKDNSQLLPIFKVSDYGISADSKEDLIDKIQALIDEVGNKGGGTIFFPKGRYLFNKSGEKRFLQINYSNISIVGETDERGVPLVELVNCGSLVRGERNPWLSPFFITTSEHIQKSNIFFGLQFRKWKKIVTRSSSMSDPGSDGNILTPKYACKVIRGSHKGEDVLYVEDASKLGNYIMLGMYNTDKEASLLKDILGQDTIRQEWQAASRAGDEEAPSFQWLIEIKEVIDNHTIRLVQPLWRDCDMRYEPVVFNVPMLENITIRDLKLSSTWNGMFRHHGHKRYYHVSQAQEMDYGWNAINIKRVAHGNIENIIFNNFTNPLYVMDSRNISCEHIIIKGHDGHQGIKVYEHSCDNLFKDITFYNHYADMMGGEGNAYGNVFTNVRYLNPCFKPVDFDFHGFSEGPMSPPSYNLFENIWGFTGIHSSGSEHMMPSCGRTNIWWNCYCEGERKGSSIFRQIYRPKLLTKDIIKIIIKMVITCVKQHHIKAGGILNCYNETKERYCKKWLMPYSEISKLYTDFYLYGVHTSCNFGVVDQSRVHIKYNNTTCIPKSII